MATSSPTPQPPPAQVVFPTDPTDRTNVDDLEALFVSTILAADWFDAAQRPIPACSVAEAFAFGQAVVETLMRTAPNKESFLMNLSGLAGGKILLQRGSLRITRLEELEDRTKYKVGWTLRYGSITGEWAMEETVLHEKWKGKKKKSVDNDGVGSTTAAAAAAAAAGTGAVAVTTAGSGEGGESGNNGTGNGGRDVPRGKQNGEVGVGEGVRNNNGDDESEAQIWKRRYEQMAATLMKRDEQMAKLQYKVLEAVKESV
jgi:hypothetical protein